METLKGKLGWKGERGFSAYEIAVKNGYEGTEQDWLATLGTASHFDETKKVYTITDTSLKSYNLPNTFTTGMFISVYLNGHRLTGTQFQLDTQNSKIILADSLIIESDSTLEIVESFLSTNNLPIMETINGESTNDSAAGAKAVYDFVNNNKLNVNSLIEDIKIVIHNEEHPIGSIYFSLVATNPSTLFGGTWQLVAQGCAIVGIGTGTDINGISKTFTARKNNGEYSHKLTISEMPSHAFTPKFLDGRPIVFNASAGDRIGIDISDGSGTASSNENVLTTNTLGGDQYHNITQPTFGLYIWERIA